MMNAFVTTMSSRAAALLPASSLLQIEGRYRATHDIVTREFCQRHTLVSVDIAQAWRFDRLCTLMFAAGSDTQRQLCTDLTHWIAVVDDLAENAGSAEEVMALVSGWWSGHGAISISMHELRDRLALGDDPIARATIDALFIRLLGFYVEEARVKRLALSMEDFTWLRVRCAGLELYEAIVHRERTTPPRPETRSAERRYLRIASTLACLANDICTHRYDAHKNNPSNYVLHFAAIHNGSLEHAWQQSCAVFEQHMQRLEALAPAVPDDVRGYAGMVLGSLQWVSQTKRYG
jgi:hypothetical protein